MSDVDQNLRRLFRRLKILDLDQIRISNTIMTSQSKYVLSIRCQRLSEIEGASLDRAEVHCPSLFMAFRILSEMSEIRLQNSENPSKMLLMYY